ncbi:MAG: hypothetical protein M0Q51_02910 [Bacteroidales bacterium]|nr:hypothetical protein [Bacteroidales bacterium]
MRCHLISFVPDGTFKGIALADPGLHPGLFSFVLKGHILSPHASMPPCFHASMPPCFPVPGSQFAVH